MIKLKQTFCWQIWLQSLDCRYVPFRMILGKPAVESRPCEGLPDSGEIRDEM